MYGFRLKFRDIRTNEVLYKLYEVDTTPLEYEDFNHNGIPDIDTYAWEDAVAAGIRKASELGNYEGWIAFEGITLLYC